MNKSIWTKVPPNYTYGNPIIKSEFIKNSGKRYLVATDTQIVMFKVVPP